jgi:peptide chain release factor subunit 1
MAATITWETLRELAGFRSEKGCAISLYVDLHPSTNPTPQDIETRLNSRLSGLEKEADARNYGGERRQALRSDLERIRRWWDDEFDRDGVHGVALFASSLDNLWRVLPLSESLQDEVRLARDLFLAPLVPLVGRGDGALVAFVNRERGQVFRLRGGRLEEVVDQSEEQPGQHDQGGWSQARYQRHIENIVQRHIKTVGEEIDRTVRGSGRPHMIVVAPEEMRGEIESELSHEVKESIVGWTSAESHASPEELLEHVRPLLDEADARDEAQVLARWEELRGRGERFASGWAATLEAASDARIETLLLEDGATHKAWQCPQDGRAQIVPGNCPLDETPLEEREDGGDVAVHLTIANGGSIVRPGTGALGGEAEGIGAILRF